MTLREDHCQVRKGDAPRVLAVLNSFLLAVLDFLGVSNVPQQMCFFDAHPMQAVHLLLGSLLTHILNGSEQRTGRETRNLRDWKDQRESRSIDS